MSEAAVRGDFSKGGVSSLILAQAVPLTLAQFVQLLYNIVDRIYIGHMDSFDAANALSGLGLCFPVITLISAFVNWISTGAAPLCSIARGRKDTQKAQDIFSTAFTLEILVSLTITLLVFAAKKPLLYLLGASDATYRYAAEYLGIYMLGTVFFAVSTGMNLFINLQGFPKTGMMITVTGTFINLLLDPLFIFVLHFGVKGAAIATVISQFCSAAWVTAFLSNKKRELQITTRSLRIVCREVGNILTLGLPGFMISATTCSVQAVCNATLSVFGGDIYVGIMTVINSVRELIILPVHGITHGAQPILSYNYGAEKFDRVKAGIRFETLMAVFYTGIFWLSTLLLSGFYLGIFSSDKEMLSAGVIPMKIYFLGVVFMALQIAGQSTFTALGKAKQAVFCSVFRKIIIVIPLTLLLPRIPLFGIMGVFWAEPISDLISGIVSYLYMYCTVYRKIGVETVRLSE